ncbi:stalk domain-containing protein [Paenibacillus graminis]|uniref:stalk domain-containing protein n=1 Tax=Paenibacillus graminis TaxID=189425 RepID=UPI002DB85563|nr:stalk domain-containing protein [Paenibacillus graminis]MEC0172240.1 stalk domain-containing protein [Paenibacillus graminis]
MKKILTASALALLIAGCAAAPTIDSVSAAAPLTLSVDGQPVLPKLHPFHSGEILYVPARALLEYYPVELKWDNAHKKLILTTNSSRSVLSPGSSAMQVQYTQTDGDYEDKLEGPVLLKEGHVYVSAGAVDLLTGAVAKLAASGDTVSITSGDVSTSKRVLKEPLAAVSSGKVKLYAARKEGSTYKGFILEVNGKKHSFQWEAPRQVSYPPELYYADVDGDGKPEATVIFNLGTGTGMSLEEVHVVKPEAWQELAVPAAEKAAAAVVSSRITLDNGDVVVRLELAGAAPSKVTLRLPGRAGDGGLEHFGTQAGIGAVTHYKVVNGKLKAETNVSIGMGESMGTLMLDYKAGSGGMVPDTIRFEPHDTTEQYVEKE